MANENIAQRITDAMLAYTQGEITLPALLGEMGTAIAELDATKANRTDLDKIPESGV